MRWSEQLFNYCERGLDPSFWAEPLNAVSNAAFLVAAAAAVREIKRGGGEPRRGTRGTLAIKALIALVGAVGCGSFLFHTFATRWSHLADVGPIAAFMAIYLVFAVRTFLAAGRLTVGLALAGFLAAGWLASQITCTVPKLGGAGDTVVPCLNGSLGYLPALLALLVVGALAGHRHAPTGRRLLAGAMVLALALVLRTLDLEACAATMAFGRPRGTHVFWHLLTALTLYLLLVAAIRHPGAGREGGAGKRDGRRMREARRQL